MAAPCTGPPALDTAVEPWHGHFPGLGEIWVTADGSTRVRPELAPESAGDSVEQRRRALTCGWADLLSWHRRGFWLLSAVTVSPDPAFGCLALVASTSRAERVLDRLSERGWLFLADRPAPARVEGEDVVAHPRGMRFLARGKRGQDDPARGDTDAVLVERRRQPAPCVVRGVCSLVRQAVGVERQEAVTGRHKFTMAAGLRLDGAFASPAPRVDPAPAMSPEWVASVVCLSRLPMSIVPVRRLAAGGHDVEADLIEAWWTTVTGR